MAVQAGLPINRPVKGDLIIPLNKKGLPQHHDPIEVTDENLSYLSDLVSKGKAFITGIILGIDAQVAGGEMGEIEQEIIMEEGISPDDFEIHEVTRVSSRGMRRELMAPIFDLKWRFIENDGISPQFDFSLFRGTYATSFMREIMKAQILDY